MTAEDKNTKQNADQPSKSKEQPSNQNDKLTIIANAIIVIFCQFIILI
jgi:hypothetical protein